MRRLLVLASVVVFFDVVFFAAVAPLLPHYVDRLGLSEAGAGVLAGAYAAGTLLASLPGGLLATRVGPRRTVIGGLLLLGVSSVVFGFAGQVVLLDASRFVQGVSGALIWSGALAWLITTAPPERRGSVIGTVLGMAVAGALVGPVLGGVAAEVGTEPVFGGVLVVAAALAALASRLPDAEVPDRPILREVAVTIASRPLLAATGFVAVPSLMFGTVGVLVPLRIDELGGGHAMIAGGFVVGAALEATLAPISGRYSDRVGRRAPFVAGIAVCATAMVGLALADELGLVLAALILSSTGAGLCFAPALSALSETAEARRLQQGFAAGLSNMAWSAGQVGGAVGSGILAAAAGYAVPVLAVAAVLVLTGAYAHRFLVSPPARPAEG